MNRRGVTRHAHPLCCYSGLMQPYTEQVIQWLTANPGRHTPAAVAAGTGTNTIAAANTLRYLANQGKVKRRRSRAIRNGPGASHYSI